MTFDGRSSGNMPKFADTMPFSEDTMPIKENFQATKQFAGNLARAFAKTQMLNVSGEVNQALRATNNASPDEIESRREVPPGKDGGSLLGAGELRELERTQLSVNAQNEERRLIAYNAKNGISYRPWLVSVIVAEFDGENITFTRDDDTESFDPAGPISTRGMPLDVLPNYEPTAIFDENNQDRDDRRRVRRNTIPQADENIRATFFACSLNEGDFIFALPDLNDLSVGIQISFFVRKFKSPKWSPEQVSGKIISLTPDDKRISSGA